MGYIEEYFHKKSEDIVEMDISSFIEQKVQECLTLDYKDFQKFDDPDGLSEHISAFANSTGGLLILGIREVENYPTEITWGDLRRKTRESLENRLLSRIYPKIDGMRIIPIYKTGSTNEGIFLIDIPQGFNPPYMAGDKKYYKRLNFQKQPMEGSVLH
ncbi:MULTISPECIES: helix-turn-helix domain-containing protein [unclassified Methanoregula]|uniref:AlbA family DNA-binding domain-containing protein n=1 Tax=unclassified Methanoregula TaxID=2649730 RepID=UPI0025EE1E54|nr:MULTISPECIES: ATP-binding protein [unclassified Methanoregula]